MAGYPEGLYTSTSCGADQQRFFETAVIRPGLFVTYHAIPRIILYPSLQNPIRRSKSAENPRSDIRHGS